MFRIELEDNVHVLKLEGRISIENTQELKSLLTDLDGTRDLIIESNTLEYIDSSGVACLVIAYKKLTSAGNKLLLRNPSEALMTVLKILKFESLFKII